LRGTAEKGGVEESKSVREEPRNTISGFREGTRRIVRQSETLAKMPLSEPKMDDWWR